MEEQAETTTRAEHLAWAKKRALEYCEAGDASSAWLSLCSDLNKHALTRGHVGVELGNQLWLGGHLSTPQLMREYVEGFN